MTRSRVALIAIPFLLAGCASNAEAGNPTQLRAAADKCHAAGDWTENDRTLNVTVPGSRPAEHPATLDELRCLVDELDAPASTFQHMGNTRRIDGIQNETWDGVTARWTYGPEIGLHVTFTDG